MSTLQTSVDIDVTDMSIDAVAEAIASNIRIEAAALALAGFTVDPLSIHVQRSGLFGTGSELVLSMKAARQ